MEAFIHGNSAWVKATKNLEKRKFGTKRGDKIILHPVEVAYLSFKGIICVKDGERVIDPIEVLEWCASLNPAYTPMFFVFQDLRERGHRVRPQGEVLVGKDIFLPVSEREHLNFYALYGTVKSLNPILAVVDEESEVTYYRLYEPELKGGQEEKLVTFRGTFTGDRVITDRKEIFEEHFYGSLGWGVVTLSLIEALYLVDAGFLEVYARGRRMSFEELWKASLSIEPNLERRYSVYKDLKSRGFVVKTGFKFGSDFRLYEEVRGVEELPHSKYLVSITDKPLPMREVARAVRLAQNVRKRMIFAFSDGEVNRYVCIERIRV
ncbi:tRNA-intron lyase [Archaeoglobus veneficus]|uniref:tRNA intron endonuclease n=1 Tax=Archaeoglobus veneficus (strain DSM 11195 / SNP6) TaxID=693661 RepID=F2KNL1_ARCVS|nr:tRNA-intron lyase [Archaeoglobus veneficus]AEA46239.1 tRNA intron endonuclease [Archaeoglobus veneficus SNP6]